MPTKRTERACPINIKGLDFKVSFFEETPASKPPSTAPAAITPCAYPYKRFAVFASNPKCCVIKTGIPMINRGNKKRLVEVKIYPTDWKQQNHRDKRNCQNCPEQSRRTRFV